VNALTFGSQACLARLGALSAEIDGVRAGEDLEHVHRMRVAVRRLRTALELFPDLVPDRAEWDKTLKRVAGSLGAARDLDVQIEFLGEVLARAPERRFGPGLRRLALRLKQERLALQPKLLKALDKFERADLAGDMNRRFSLRLAETPQAAVIPQPESDLLILAATDIAARLRTTLAFDSLVQDPARAEDLHQLRIAFKHLRYTLEILAPLFKPAQSLGEPIQVADAPEPAAGLEPYIKIVRTFQEILGELHDCDVWAEQLPAFLSAERKRTTDYYGHDRIVKGLEAGLNYLLEERRYHRTVRYDEFIDLWIAHREARTWTALQDQAAARAAPPPLAAELPELLQVALIGDVHGNLPALEAVLGHARKHGVALIWCVGDLVGYGPYPDEVIKRLRDENCLGISGNYDQKVLQVKSKKEKWRKSKRPEKLLAFDWAYDHTSPEARQYLAALPPERRFSVHGKRILLTHGSPDSNEEPLSAETPLSRLQELARKASADLVISGHSHQAFTRTVEGVLFINTGSVGRPDDGDPRACYAILKLTPDSVEVRHYRVKYDTALIAAAVREQGLPESFARIFLHGRGLDDLVLDL
jgi:putative phosphoesterase